MHTMKHVYIAHISFAKLPHIPISSNTGLPTLMSFFFFFESSLNLDSAVHICMFRYGAIHCSMENLLLATPSTKNDSSSFSSYALPKAPHKGWDLGVIYSIYTGDLDDLILRKQPQLL